MNRLIIGLLAGALAGAVLTYVILGSNKVAPPAEVVRDIVVVEKMSEIVADEHRQDRYAVLQTVEQIYALPTEFARAEALYAIAGREDSAGVQRLIFEANRIADREDRSVALNILFFRLTEMDPQSALALARTESFRGDRSHEQRVWIAWARRDLDEALFEAKTQTSSTYKKLAARSLYTAFGYMGNEITDRIEQELGIGPDRNIRGRFIYQLSDRSPVEAIAFINAMEPGTRQEEFVSWLAHHLSADDPASAETYAGLFTNENYQRNYRAIVANNAARVDPIQILDRLLTMGENSVTRSEFHFAVSTLASNDLDAAMQYYENVRTPEARQMFGSALASEYAKKNPVSALAWAKANEDGEHPVLQMQVLRQIAINDPELAFNEALTFKNHEHRDNLMSQVISAAANSDPSIAVALLDRISNAEVRRSAASNLVSQWVRSDPEAAVGWILQNDERTVAELMMQATSILVRTDIDAAIRLLPRTSGVDTRSMRAQIAQGLVSQRSPADAQNFIRQFEGEDGYAQLQSTVITTLARTDPNAARNMIALMTPGPERNQVTAGVARNWYQIDPRSASVWVNNMPRGPQQDFVISNLSSGFREATPAEQELVRGISDPVMRSRAQMNMLRQLIRSDPDRARRLLNEMEVSDEQHRQYEEMLRQMRGG